MERDGDKALATDECGEYCYFWFESLSIQRADGQPFALYDFDFDGYCSFIYGCEIRAQTSWGETITPSSEPIGTGGWLSLQSIQFSGETLDWSCEFCYLSVDDLKIKPATRIEIVFLPFSASENIRPKDAYYITVGLKNTSIADGDTADFDPLLVDPATLRLGPDHAEVTGLPLEQDFDGDGDIDKTFGFRVEDTGQTCTQTSIQLTGSTYTGTVFAGNAAVNPVGCEEPMPIDVEPYSAFNRVYPDDSYQLQVAILSTSVSAGDAYDFNPGSVSLSALQFGPGETGNVMAGGSISTDVDGDGDTDRIFAFEMQDSGIFCGDTEVQMTSTRSVAGGDIPIPLIGTDSIQTEDCTTTTCHP